MSPRPPSANPPEPPPTLTVSQLKNKRWRLENLYHIQSDDGKKIRFYPNPPQRYLWNNMWYRNIILKARKLGFSTFIDLHILDECLFNDNIEGAIVADNLAHAQAIFRRTIKFAYDNLPESVRSARRLTTESKTELSFNNGSLISVGVTMRSQSPQLLHISEFGIICVKAPDKAREIVTGTLQSVEISGDQMVWIESTAAGRSGYFYDYCETAKKRIGKKLTKLDFKFFFFPWWLHPGHVLEEAVTIPAKLIKYFQKLQAKSKNKKRLSIKQKSWYTRQSEILGPDIKAEHPSTPEEAFEVVQEGMYFREQFVKIRQQKRIGVVSLAEGVPVDTYWDLGVDDLTDIIFAQTIGEQVHVIDFFEDNDAGLEYYIDIVKGKPYRYGRHWAPHDMQVMGFGSGKTRVEQGLEMGIRFKVVPRVENKGDSIEAARRILKYCWFDEHACMVLIDHLELYRKKWDNVNGIWLDKPVHDIHSNAADALQTLAMSHTFNANSLQLNSGSVDDWAC